MTTGRPRLLLVVREDPAVRTALTAGLPEVAAVGLDRLDADDRGSIEAALVGSIVRDGAGWDPASFPRLRFVQRTFAGVDDLPFERFPATVEIAGNIGAYAPFVSEHAVALALASARALPEGAKALAELRLRPTPEMGSLSGATATVLGFGAVGSAIAERLRPFGTRLVAVTRTGAPIPGIAETFPAERLREAVAGASFVFDARPLTHRTRASIGAAELAAMPDDATFVNVGRAATVDPQALFDHLQSHPKFRAALDVWWGEDFAAGQLRLPYPFTTLPNVLGTPHWAGYGPGVEQRGLALAVENLARFFAGERPRHLVDRDEYDAPAVPEATSGPAGAPRPR